MADLDAIKLPGDLTLRLALTRGPYARVTGGMGGYNMFRPKAEGRNVGMTSLSRATTLLDRIASLENVFADTTTRWPDGLTQAAMQELRFVTVMMVDY